MEKELPIGWVETKLGIIAEWGSGGTPNRSEPNYYNGTIPWVKTGDLNDSIIFEASEYITELGLRKSSAKLFPKGSIIVAMYGATIGKTAKLGIDATTNQACAVAQASKIVIPEFLHYFLKAEKQEFIDKGKGGAQPNISQTVIKEHPFSLPPFPEQQRIVAKLDTLFGHLDQIKNRWINFQTVVDSFVESAIVDTSTGNYFKVEKLKNYLVEGTERIGKNWQGKRKVGISAKDGIIELATGQKETFEKYKIVKPGDFVYNAMRVNIGSIGIYEGKDIAITSPDYVVFRIKSKLSPKLLLRFLKSQRGLLEIGTNTQGSVRSRLYFKYLVNINYPVASEKIQSLAEKFLSSVFKASEKWKNQIEPNLDNLRQALLAKAFRGELVEQLPTDGDARDLLEQIKTISKISKSKRNEN